MLRIIATRKQQKCEASCLDLILAVVITCEKVSRYVQCTMTLTKGQILDDLRK